MSDENRILWRSPKDRLDKVMEEILPEFVLLMNRTIKEQAALQNLEASGELQQSIRTKIMHEAMDLQREVVTDLNFYGRFHDLKYLEYYNQWRQPDNRGKKYKQGDYSDHTPSIVLAMEEFIKKSGGMNAFKYTPGRLTGMNYMKKLTEQAKIRRLAWTLAAYRLKQQRIRNRRKKYWYSEALKIIRNKAANRVREMTAKGMLDFLKEGINGMQVKI